MTTCLDGIRNCLEGFVPALIATCGEDGVPNVAMISQVHYVDPGRVALSYQFFNKTRRNLIATRTAAVAVNDPVTCERFRLALDYQETQTAGPIFEAMKAKLAGIASHSGMQGVFQLLGSDIFRVRSIEPIPGQMLAVPHKRPLMPAVRRFCARLSMAGELGALFDAAMAGVAEEFGIEHAMLLMLEPADDRLYVVASHGYAASGIGSEIVLGEGVIGVAAREAVPIRIGSMTSEYSYGDAIRKSAQRSGLAWFAAREIPYPGLEAPQSQLALPIRCAGRTLGVLFVESHEPMRFWYDDEDAMAVAAEHLGLLIALLQREDKTPDAHADAPATVADRTVVVRRYHVDNSIFLDHDYLIKGVAGAIFWKILGEHLASGRTEFTNRELRLDPALRLPEHAENLEARLLLLTRRLAERTDCIRIDRSGRGRFHLHVTCRFALEDVCAGDRSPAA